MGTVNDASRARTDSLRVKLAEGMVERLDAVSKDFGMPTATMAAFALAQWITDYENKQKLTRQAVLELTRRLSSESLGNTLENALAKALPEITFQMAKAGYTLDYGGPDQGTK